MTISAEQLTSTLPGLRAVRESAVAHLARASSLRIYGARAVLYRAGDVADGLYVVMSGRVIVRRETSQRSEMLHTERAGGVLGEIPVFGGGHFPATAVALEPTQCCHVPIAVVERLLRDEPSFARLALERMAARAQSLLQRIDELTASTVTNRLAAYVVARAEQSTTADFTLGMSQSELANELGTAREVIVRGIAKLIEAGAIARTGRSRFAVRRLTTLRAIAGEVSG
jgi:CRP/FNR family transcriptional regulator